VITPVQILQRLLELQGSGDFLKLLGKKSLEVFVGELIWRDFYQMVLYQFPHVSKHQPFKADTRHIQWTSGKTADHYFKAWAEGQTGFPIVDAAMRCLNQTGYMHNRLRMVTAMFFSKLLLLDWRRGEQYFMQHLIDGELGANNGGWQWCASTGTDAVPYFRIFNPTTQSQKFDAEGHFIRQYVPELARLSAKAIHDPSPNDRQTCGYKDPLIDYVAQRKLALSVFK
jgi:deoxyribodipyrimidine photo-lyase